MNEHAEPPRLTLEQWHRLVEAGVVGKVELLEGVAWIGEHRLQWSESQIAAARAAGVDLE